MKTIKGEFVSKKKKKKNESKKAKKRKGGCGGFKNPARDWPTSHL
jgi:hypothetical protein